MDEISVIICAYTEKRWHELLAAIHSVRQQTLQPADILVVIDHNPSLLLRLQQKQLPGVSVIENRGDKGLSGARNSGWMTAQGEIVAFLDDDALAEPDWLEQLAICYANPAVLGVGGKLIPLWKTRQPDWFPGEFNWVIGCTYRGLPTRNAVVRNVIGANMSMRKSVLTRVGGFREAFGCDKNASTAPRGGVNRWLHHYAGDEETEFCIRASGCIPNGVWLYATAAIVRHQVSPERTRWSYFLWRCYDEGLGKASLAHLHTATTSLSSERTYTLQVLPRGVVRGLADTFLRLDPHGLRRSTAIVVGFVATATGYLVGSLAVRVDNMQTKQFQQQRTASVKVR